MSFIAACVQTNSSDDVAKNIAAIEAFMLQAIAQKAQLIWLPENVFYMRREGTPHAPACAMEQHEGVTWAIKFAAQHNLHILVGSIRAQVDGFAKPMNRSLLIGPQGIVAHYDKLHLFDVTLPDGTRYHESAQSSQGHEAVLAQTALGKIGLSICYDVRFPNLYRQLALAGAEILTVPSAFTRPTGEAHWHALLRARAIENGAYVIAPAQCGEHAGGRTTYGHSLIIDPWGKILAEAGDAPCVITAEIDVGMVQKTRQQLPVLQHHREIKETKIF